MDALEAKLFIAYTDDAPDFTGHVVRAVSASPVLYLVSIMDWATGGEDHRRLVPVTEMLTWKFFDSAKEWNKMLTLHAEAQSLPHQEKG